MTYIITKGMLIYPTVDCSMKSNMNEISIDKVKIFRQEGTRLKVANDLASTLFRQSNNEISTLVRDKADILNKVAVN